MLKVYYEYEKFLGVNCQWFNGDCFEFDYFSSMHVFNAWLKYEMNGAESVEVTDENYHQLKIEGHISG